MAELKTMQCPKCSERFDFDATQVGILTCPYCQATFEMRRRRTAQVQPISADGGGAAAPGATPPPVPADDLPAAPQQPGVGERRSSSQAMSAQRSTLPGRTTRLMPMVAGPVAEDDGNAARADTADTAVAAGSCWRFTPGVGIGLGVCLIALALVVVGVLVTAQQRAERERQAVAYQKQADQLQQMKLEYSAQVRQLELRQQAAAALAGEIEKQTVALEKLKQTAPAVVTEASLTARKAELEAQLAESASLTAAIQQQPRQTTENVALEKKASVVIVRNGASGFGTGFVVSGSRVITNFHVIGAEADVAVRYLASAADANGAPVYKDCKNVRVLAVDKPRDLALLAVEFEGPAVAALTLQPQITQGERVCAIGNPGVGRQMLEHTVSEGIVSGLNRRVEDQQFHQVTAAINPGNSGGPVFNMKGEVLGVATLKAAGVDNLGFIIPAAEVQRFLDGWETWKVPGSYEEFLIKLDPVKYHLELVRRVGEKYMTSTPITFAYCAADVDGSGNLWVADIEGNRLVNFNEKTLKSTREVALSGRPTAMVLNRSAGIAYVMLAGGRKIAKVSLGASKELEALDLPTACYPILQALDGQNLMVFNQQGGLSVYNVVTKKFVDLGRAISLKGLQPLTISVGTRTVDIVGLDPRSRSLVVRSDTIFQMRQLATLINQADKATTEQQWVHIVEQILKTKYFDKESQVPLKYVQDKAALFNYHEGPNNSCYIGNAIMRGPPPYKAVGALPSVLNLLGATEEVRQLTELENLYCTSSDLHYGATALAIYDLLTNKPVMPLPFISNQTIFSKDGKTIYFFAEREDGKQTLYRFPWKEVPEFDWSLGQAGKPEPPVAP